jgi:hypothetical protein
MMFAEGANADAYRRSLAIANGILDGKISDPTRGATFFYNGTTPSGFFTDAINDGRLDREGRTLEPFTFHRQIPRRRR